MTDLQYPIGKYEAPEVITPDIREEWIQEIQELPFNLRALVRVMTEAQLNMHYRPDGWKGIQVIHHLVDSHINSYVRFKLALTEDNPTIKPYAEHLWAVLPDANEIDVAGSLDLLDGLHAKLVKVFRNMEEDDWQRTFYHPESKTKIKLDWNLGMYAWHGKHHMAHLQLLC